MDAMEAILTRRSVRQYSEGSISEGTVQNLLQAAMSAPSAGNQQPWQYIVIDDRSILNDIPKVHPYSGMLKQAPLAIVVCGDMDREKHKGYWIQDCSAATQNLLIAARALGLGAVWLGVYPLEDRIKGISQLLNLPQSIIPLAVISIGQPTAEQGEANRYDANRIHKNKWQGK
jgi:nitroreductase